jgi:acetyltransferase-like isoleucine patch superfamily enzyme
MIIKKNKIPFLSMAIVGCLPSALKKLIYKARGYKFGQNTKIGFGSVIIGNSVEMGDNSRVGLFTVVRANDINIGRFVTIGSFTMIDTGRLVMGEDSRINEQVIVGGTKTASSALILGKRTIIMEYSFINTSRPITIGDDSGVGGHCLLFTHGSWLNELDGFPVTFAAITIGKKVWLPWRVFVMPGVEIGDNVVVGANSLISRSVPSNVLVAGSPATVLKTNYPTPISAEKKMSLFRGYLKEFEEHLAFNHVSFDIAETHSSYIMSGKNGEEFKMMVLFDSILPEYNKVKNLLIVANIETTHIEIPVKMNSNIMFLDINNKKRKGTTGIGEEFSKFISRFGVRFDRMD